MRRYLIPVMMFVCVAWLDPFHDAVLEGNDNFSAGKYDEAIKRYNDADGYSASRKNKAGVDYNRGTAYAKKKDFQNAVDAYAKGAAFGDAETQKKALFNLGNLYRDNGKRREAAESYIAALKIDPSYEKARKNLELLTRKDDQKKDDKNKDEKDGDQKKDDDKQQSDKDKKEQNKDQNNKNNGDNKKNQSGQDNKDQQNGDDQKSAGQKIDPKLLEGILEQMKNSPVRKNKESKNAIFATDKDW